MKRLSFLFAAIFLLSACSDSGKKKSANNTNNNQLLGYGEILNACLVRDACDVMPVGYISDCVKAHYNQAALENQQAIWNQIYRCVLAAGGNCTEVKKCFGNGSLPSTCDPQTEKGRCEGDVRYWCDSFTRQMYAMNCREAGMTCVVSTEGYPQCSLGSCTDDTYNAMCDGDIQRVCANGYINTIDCTALALPCIMLQVDESVFRPYCMQDGPQCKPDEYEGVCEGSIQVDCNRMGVVQHVDCSQLPGEKTCVMTVNGPSCNAAGTECSEGEEGCLDDYTARVCLDGTVYTVNCQDLGFTRCTGRGASHDIGAHCTR